MANIARGDVEILVHTTAPSRGQDDARYRAFAQAYLDFEPTGRLELNGERLDKRTDADSQLQEELLRSTQDRSSQVSYQPQEEPESIPISVISTQQRYLNRTEELELLNSPDLSFDDVLDNADSPVFRNYITCKRVVEGDIESSQDSWKPPPSTVAGSQPDQERLPITSSSPPRILEALAENIRQSQRHDGVKGTLQDPSPELPYNLIISTSESSIIPQTPFERSGNSSSPSPQPSSNFPSKHENKQRAQNIFAVQEKGLRIKRKHFELSIKSQPSPSARSRASLESSTISSSRNSLKRQRIELDQVQVARSDVISSDKATEVATPTPSTTTLRWLNELEIRPPQPKTTMMNLTPESLITYSLKDTAKKMPLDILFQPIEEARELRPMERGHWLIKCQSWNMKLRERCWDCLGNFIAKGHAGWGVWCVRDEGFESIRVYCWGIVVKHIYLFLFLASETKVKRVGACWIGGDGQIIIRMQA
jgi:hypothetical protein